MNKFFKTKFLAFALVCILLGSFVGAHFAGVQADEKVILTSPFTAAVEKVHSSVVGINNYATKSIEPYGNFGGFGFDFPFGFRFPESPYPNSESEILYGAGSGVVVAKDYVITNYHVVEGSNRLTAVVNEKEYDAELVAYNELKDVAIVHVKNLNVAAVELGDSSKLQIGDWAIAIGNPVSLPGTTTVGVISSTDRKISTSDYTDRYGKRSENYNTMIQTDAAINSGNSGGGLFNTSGELIGIPTLKYANRSNLTNSAPIDGIGFAIPINEVKEIIDNAINGKGEMISKEDAQHGTALTENPKPRMGVTISNINPNSPAVLSGKIPQGISVRNVEKNSPAELAGIKVDDIIVDIDDTIVKTANEMMEIISKKNADDIIKVKVYRVPDLANKSNTNQLGDGEYLDFEVKLAIIDGAKQ